MQSPSLFAGVGVGGVRGGRAVEPPTKFSEGEALTGPQLLEGEVAIFPKK